MHIKRILLYLHAPYSCSTPVCTVLVFAPKYCPKGMVCYVYLQTSRPPRRSDGYSYVDTHPRTTRAVTSDEQVPIMRGAAQPSDQSKYLFTCVLSLVGCLLVFVVGGSLSEMTLTYELTTLKLKASYSFCLITGSANFWL